MSQERQQKDRRLKGRRLQKYLAAVRRLQQALHLARQDPHGCEAQQHLQDRLHVQLDALARARALTEGRAVEPAGAASLALYPSLNAGSLRAAPGTVEQALQAAGFKGDVIAAVCRWVLDLADARDCGPGTGRRWPEDSRPAADWKAFQAQHRQRLLSGERSSLKDLEVALASMKQWLELFRDHEFLQDVGPQALEVFRLRHHALCRAIARRRAKARAGRMRSAGRRSPAS